MERFCSIQDLYARNGQLSERCLSLNRLRLAGGSSWALWWVRWDTTALSDLWIWIRACCLTCFPGWSAQFSQAMWPASEEGGEVVPAPEEHGPAQSVQEVQRGLVSRSTSHELRFSLELSSTESSLPPPALHPYTEIPAPCLPSIPMQRDPSSLSAFHPYAETILGLPWPTWLCYNSLLLLCYGKISFFSPLFAIPSLLLLLYLYSLLGPCFWLFLTLSHWHPALTHIWTWKTLCCLHLSALLLLQYLLKMHPFFCLSHGFPFCIDSFCCTFSATILHTVAFKSYRQQAGLDSAVICLQHPESHKPAPFHGGEHRSVWAKSKTCLGNSCVEILFVMWRHKINLRTDRSECQSWLSFPQKRRILPM